MPDLTFLNQISTFIAICTAIYGLNSWRREHRGKRQAELCEDALTLFYEAKSVIGYVRSPASFTSETDEIVRQEAESIQKYQARKAAFVVFKRFRDHKELFAKIHAMRYRFMAQIGKEQAEPFEELRRVQNEIQLAAEMLSHLWAKTYYRTEDQLESDRTMVKKYESIFWEGMAEAYGLKDDIPERIDALISNLEKTSKTIIEGRGWISGFLDRKLGRER
jgi:hypothetical protein